MTISRKWWIKFPDPDTIIFVLEEVVDSRALSQNLYPLIAERAAGREMFYPAALMLFLEAVEEFLDRGNYRRKHRDLVENELLLHLIRWIDALVSDKDVATAMKTLLRHYHPELS